MEFTIRTNRDEFRKTVPKNIGGVYFLYDKNMQLLYIGKAVGFRNRFESHLYGCSLCNEEARNLFNTFFYINLLVIDDEEKALTLELEYIQKYNPICNTVGVTIPKLSKTPRQREPKGSNKIAKQVRLPADTYQQTMELIDKLNKTSYSNYSFNSVLDVALKAYIPELEKGIKFWEKLHK